MGPRVGIDGCENIVPTGIRSPNLPVLSESLYLRLHLGTPSGIQVKTDTALKHSSRFT